MRSFDYHDLNSLIPAIQILHGIGWQYLSNEEALQLRGGRQDRVVLTGILRPWLAKNNIILAKGETHPFNDSNLNEALRRVTDIHYDGLVYTNENIYNLLTIGTSLEQTVNNDRKGRQLKYIDWRHPENNVYHMTSHFRVEKSNNHESRQVGLVCFVNGIPLVVIECKHNDANANKQHCIGEQQLDTAIEQLIDYQKANEIPGLFQYTQILLASSSNEIKYATVNTPATFWSVWREENTHFEEVEQLANQALPVEIQTRLLSIIETEDAVTSQKPHETLNRLWAQKSRPVTTQDKVLCSMLRPQRLLELIYGYIVFDAGVRKIARYQQYFAVKATIERVRVLHQGRRLGGIVWHTTGSGKSLTMVMLAKALAIYPGIVNPRVVLVTDRIDLDKQIVSTFNACGKTAIRAKTGEELVNLIHQGKANVITTVIDKFNVVMSKHKVIDNNPDIIILVDEGHRSNYGKTASDMRRVFPNGAFIGFTGTPIFKKEKNTIKKFGGIIHSYSMRQATVKDHAVLPLMYEGRIAELDLNQHEIQSGYERLSQRLSEQQKTALNNKLLTRNITNRTEQRLNLIAHDISWHYKENVQGLGLKAQLAVDSRSTAILYRRFINEIGLISCEVIMSKPDESKGNERREDEASQVNQFWHEMMHRYATEKNYLDEILGSFARADGVELLIVVNKLLTGFDEPRNTVLYVDKPLKGHNILQAIARVNRLFPGKEFGYIIDYRGILGELNEAMQTYEGLAEFDAEDVNLQDVLMDTVVETSKLAHLHTEVWAVFKHLNNKNNAEFLLQQLDSCEQRQRFYTALQRYQNLLSLVLSTQNVEQNFTAEQIEAYKNDLKLFRRLRTSVQQRYAEVKDDALSEKQLRKVLNNYIQAPEISAVTKMFNIFDIEAFDAEVERQTATAAKADTIANRIKITVLDKMDDDPVFYQTFAEQVQRSIDDYRQKRIDETQYLVKVKGYLKTLRRGYDKNIPERLKDQDEAQAYYGILTEVLSQIVPPSTFERASQEIKDGMGEYGVLNRQTRFNEKIAEMAMVIKGLIDKHKIRDWVHNQDIIRLMQNDIDDYLFTIRDESNIDFQTNDMDQILARCLSVALNKNG